MDLTGPIILLTEPAKDVTRSYSVKNNIYKRYIKSKEAVAGGIKLSSDTFIHMTDTDTKTPNRPEVLRQWVVNVADGEHEDIDELDAASDDESSDDSSDDEIALVDVTQPPHMLWDYEEPEDQEDYLLVFWDIIHEKKRNCTRVEKLKFAAGFREIYSTLEIRLSNIFGATRHGNKYDLTTCIYDIIGRGYNVVEAVLESPDLMIYFMEHEKMTKPDFSGMFAISR